mmetsp:Transcript_4397/g.8955  ORF Transcript_4397/g.8955 Transcript_4397/m.8955 type:complete len:93 (+) Transcript_4397:2489-2767(+)
MFPSVPNFLRFKLLRANIVSDPAARLPTALPLGNCCLHTYVLHLKVQRNSTLSNWLHRKIEVGWSGEAADVIPFCYTSSPNWSIPVETVPTR